jgi:hypothetical protein
VKVEFFAPEDWLPLLNKNLRDGCAALRRSEAQYRQPFVLVLKLNAKGVLQLHIEPEGTLQS